MTKHSDSTSVILTRGYDISYSSVRCFVPYAAFRPVAYVPTINTTPLASPKPAPPSAVLPTLMGATPILATPLLAATTPASAPTPVAPNVSQSVSTSPLFSRSLQLRSCHSISLRPRMRPHVIAAPARVPRMRPRPELRRTVGRSGCLRRREEMREMGSERKVKDIAEARITCR